MGSGGPFGVYEPGKGWVTEEERKPEVPVTHIASRRKTSNSRGPGQEGTVQVRKGLVRICRKCKRLRFGEGPHSPHWRAGVLVDCVGDEVRR